MARYQAFYLTNSGSPLTGASPTWHTLKHLRNGVNYASAPSIVEVGGGWYRFEIDLLQYEELVGVIDAGAGVSDAAERYKEIRFSFVEKSKDENKEIYVNQVYDEDTDSLTFVVFTLVNGEVLTANLSSVSLSVYDDNHDLQFTISTSTFSNGVAILTKSTPSLTANQLYYSTVTLTTSFETLVSNESFIVLE